MTMLNIPMTKIYIAGPLFSEAEKEFNKNVNEFLTEIGFNTFLPQHDGHQLSVLLDNGDSIKKARKKIFDLDIKELEKTDVVLFIMDGRVPDEGACVEIGYAYAKGKECIGLKTDSRTLIGKYDNPLITGVLKNRIAKTFEELESILKNFKEEKNKVKDKILSTIKH